MKPSIFALVALALSGCATTGPVRTIDASHGQPSVQFTISADGSGFIGAAPASFFVNDTLIANIRRGEVARAALPCGTNTYAAQKMGDSNPTDKTRSLTFDPCDGGITGLRISFEPFDGFYLTRQM